MNEPPVSPGSAAAHHHPKGRTTLWFTLAVLLPLLYLLSWAPVSAWLLREEMVRLLSSSVPAAEPAFQGIVRVFYHPADVICHSSMLQPLLEKWEGWWGGASFSSATP